MRSSVAETPPNVAASDTMTNAATFLTPLAAVQRDQLQMATITTTTTTGSGTPPSPQPTPSSGMLRYTIPVNASASSASTTQPTTAPLASPTSAQPSPAHQRFIIVKKSPPASGTPTSSTSASSTPMMQSRPSISDVLVGTDLLAVNATRPLERPSPALLAAAAAAADSPTSIAMPPPAVVDTPVVVSAPTEVAISQPEEHDDSEIPLPSDLPASHPAAYVRPPTPPSARSSKRSTKRNSTGMPLVSPIGSGKDQFLSPSPQPSARTVAQDMFKRSPSSAARMLDPLDDALEGGNEFSAALRAALAEAGNVGGGGAEPRSGQSSFKNRKDADHALSAREQTQLSPVPQSTGVTPTEEITDRELRKQAIRQKNAMHMRIRNASVGTILASSSRPVGRSAAAVPNALTLKEPSTPRTPIQSSPSAGLESLGGAAHGTRERFLKPLGDLVLEEKREDRTPMLSPQQADSADLLSPNSIASPSGNTPAASFASSAAMASMSAIAGGQRAVQRTRSSILKPTSTPIALVSSATPQRSRRGSLNSTQGAALKRQLSNSNVQATAGGGGNAGTGGGIKRQPSGIMRMPSLKTSTTVAGGTSATAGGGGATVGSTPTDLPRVGGPALQRANTSSRVGFIVHEGGIDSELSTDSDDGEEVVTDEEPVGGKKKSTGPLDTPTAGESGDTKGRVATSPKSRRCKSVVTSVGIASLHVPSSHDGDEDQHARKKVFVQDGSQLLLRSVSTTGGGAVSQQAANVMVLSVSSIFTRLRTYTLRCFFLSMAGVMLTILNKELYHSYPGDTRVAHIITAVRFLTSASTAGLIFCLYKYYQADFQFLQLNRVYLLRSQFWNTQLIWQFVLEVAICLIHEPPYVNHDTNLSITDAATLQSLRGFTNSSDGIVPPAVVRNPWSLLIALRFYFILRVILSRYYTGGTRVIGLWFNFDFSTAFATRNMLYSHPLLSLAPVVLMFIFGCTYSLWVFEREGHRDFDFGTSLWVVLITMTSVGFGDAVPLTSGGRGVCVLAAFIGIMVTAVLVAAVHQKLTLLPYEGRMVEFLQRDDNTASLKYMASRCISRSWRYYRIRKHCVQLVKVRKFTFMARANLIRYKTVMLQGIFDFQTARKHIQAYDRRYHSEQLFRAMLEGLYDKLETMTLDFHVLEDELDLSYEEQRNFGLKQVELLNELNEKASSAFTPGSGGPSAGASGSSASPEHGRLALLRTSSIPTAADGAGRSTPSASHDTPMMTREPSGMDLSFSAMPSGRVSAIGMPSESQAPDELLKLHSRHQSMRDSLRLSKEGVEAAEVPGLSVAVTSPSHSGAATAPVRSTQGAFSDAIDDETSRRGGHLNSKRASTLGGLDLAAAAAAATAAGHKRLASQQVPESGQSIGHLAENNRSSMKVFSSSDLHSIHVESPRMSHPTQGTLSTRIFVTNPKRASLTQDVTNDLLSVVAALSPSNNPELPPAPAGRIRFGESDFGAHRAAVGRTSRQTLQRKGTFLDRAMTSNVFATPVTGQSNAGSSTATGQNSPDGKGTPVPATEGPTNSQRPHPHFRRPSSMEMLLQQSAKADGASTAGGAPNHLQTPDVAPPIERTLTPHLHSPTTSTRPLLVRAPSSGSTLRHAAVARVAASGHSSSNSISSDQFDRLMVVLGNLSERLAGVETQLAIPRVKLGTPVYGSALTSPIAQPTPTPTSLLRLEDALQTPAATVAALSEHAT